ncbi:Alpha-tectorin [Exaiptasia diaphana]|nr:Alpha-tectorin [Exaiptasia diaphana]
MTQPISKPSMFERNHTELKVKHHVSSFVPYVPVRGILIITQISIIPWRWESTELLGEGSDFYKTEFNAPPSPLIDSNRVNINGVISFQKTFQKYKPKTFPLAGSTIIAPFWADVSTNKGGAIWYRQTTCKDVLKVASLDIRKAFPEFQYFSAIWMFVATWEQVNFYGSKNKNITNTFQSVLLTDGRYSFVRFNYQNIAWTSGTESGGNASNGLGGTEAGVKGP